MAKQSIRARGGDDDRPGVTNRDTPRLVTINPEFGRALSTGDLEWYRNTHERWPKICIFEGDTYLGFTRNTLVHFWDTEADPAMPKHCCLPATRGGYNFKSLSAARSARPDGKLLVIAPESGAWFPFGNRIPVLAWLYGQWSGSFGSLGQYHPERRGSWRLPVPDYGGLWNYRSGLTTRGDLQYPGQLYLYGYTKNEFFPPYSWGEELRKRREAEAQRLREEQERLRQEQLEMERQLYEQTPYGEPERNFAPDEHRNETDRVDAFITASLAAGITDPDELARQLRRLGLTAPPTQDLSTVPPPRKAIQRAVVSTDIKSRKILRRKRKK